MNGWKITRCIGYGFLLGTAGIKLLSGKDAKKAYTHITAAVMRCVDGVVKTATTLKENCDDIAADAKDINEKRYAAEREQEIRDARELLDEAGAAE